jgi:hypothetical protein
LISLWPASRAITHQPNFRRTNAAHNSSHHDGLEHFMELQPLVVFVEPILSTACLRWAAVRAAPSLTKAGCLTSLKTLAISEP